MTGLESVVWQLTIFVFIYKTGQSKPVNQEVNGTMILPPPLAFPAWALQPRGQYERGVGRFGAAAPCQLPGCQMSKYPTR